MLKNILSVAVASGTALAVIMTPARAEVADGFAAALYEGRTGAAAALAAQEIDGQARFALGAAQFLHAVERLGNGLYRVGLQPDYGGSITGLAGLPFVRLPLPVNPQPEQPTYEGLRAILDRFVADLAIAEKTLKTVEDKPFTLTLNLGRIRLDFNGDGTGSENEQVLAVLAAVASRARSDTGYVVDFDQSDAPWLAGYCNLLSALSKILLAYDWHETFDNTFQSLFPAADLPSSPLREDMSAKRAELEAFLAEHGPPPPYPRMPLEPAGRPRLTNDISRNEWQRQVKEWEAGEAYQSYLASQAYKDWEVALAARNAYPFPKYYSLRRTGGSEEGIADLIGFIHLLRWPVVRPEAMAGARQDLLDMIALSRENWRRIGEETDNGREWVPSPDQTGIFGGLRVDQTTVAAWHGFLDRFEAVLEGRQLIQHWRFETRGVNVRRMFEEPRTLDAVMIVQGAAIIPYLEEGDIVTAQTGQTMMRLFGGGFFAYFLWFN